MNKKTLLKNAKIYNGTTDAAFVGDVLIEVDRIAEVAPSIAACDECEVTELQFGFLVKHKNELLLFDSFILSSSRRLIQCTDFQA